MELPLEALELHLSLELNASPRPGQFAVRILSDCDLKLLRDFFYFFLLSQVDGAWIHGAKWNASAQYLVEGGSTAIPLTNVSCFWMPRDEISSHQTHHCQQQKMPVYLTEERKDLVAAVLLSVESGSILARNWFEIGPAITLWGHE